MRYITEIIKYFTFITTGIVILFIIIMLIQGNDSITLSSLIEIPCAGLVCSVTTVLLYPAETKTKSALFVRMAIHYLALCVVMTVVGIMFGWISFNMNGILLMLISVAVIYAFTFGVAYITSKNDADEVNKVLKKMQSELRADD